MKIDIDIDDERRFSDVALVVDRDSFQMACNKLRRAMRIDNLLTRDSYIAYKRKVWRTKKHLQLENEIEKARRRLRLPVTFKKVIEYATFCGQVTSDDYKPAFLDSKADLLDEKGDILDETYFIVLSPGVRDKDVLKEVQKYRDGIENKFDSTEYPGYQYLPHEFKSKDKLGASRLHRDWYWESKDKNVEKIWLKWLENCPLHSENTAKIKSNKCTCNLNKTTVSSGINEYSKFVNQF